MANPDYTAQDVPTWAANLDSMNSLKAIGNIKNPLLHLPLLNSLAFARGVGSLTFARASVATYIDRYGVVQSAAIDEPRFESNGLLVEGASTNKLLWSDDFTDAVWLDGSGLWTVVGNNQTAPDGVATSADTITVTGTIAKIRQNVVLATGSSASMWVKILSGTLSEFKLDHGDGASVDVTSDILAAAGEWARVKIPNMTKGVSNFLDIDITFAGSGATLSIWRAQFEELPFATSGISTTTVAVTRSVEALDLTISGNIGLQANAGTILCDVDVLGFMGSATLQTAFAIAGETNRRIFAANGFLTNKASVNWGPGDLAGLVLTVGVASRLSIVHDGSSGISFWQDGIEEDSSSGADVSDSLGTDIDIGSFSASSQLFGHISNVRIYDIALSDREMAVA